MELVNNIFVFSFNGESYSFYRSAWIGRTLSEFIRNEKSLGLSNAQMEEVWDVMFPAKKLMQKEVKKNEEE